MVACAVRVSHTGRWSRRNLPQIRAGHRFEKREHPGKGVGLAMARQIVAAHGRHSVESEPGEGVVFTVMLPCQKRRETHDQDSGS